MTPTTIYEWTLDVPSTSYDGETVRPVSPDSVYRCLIGHLQLGKVVKRNPVNLPICFRCGSPVREDLGETATQFAAIVKG